MTIDYEKLGYENRRAFMLRMSTVVDCTTDTYADPCWESGARAVIEASGLLEESERLKAGLDSALTKCNRVSGNEKWYAITAYEVTRLRNRVKELDGYLRRLTGPIAPPDGTTTSDWMTGEERAVEHAEIQNAKLARVEAYLLACEKEDEFYDRYIGFSKGLRAALGLPALEEEE